MNDHELRAMVRESIARQLAAPGTVSLKPDPGSRAAFVRLLLPSGGDGDGACLIEPSVRCNHCGYCQSYGH